MAEGHLGALKKLHDFKTGMGEITGADDSGFHIYNLGIGDSTTVMDMVEAMEKASGLKVETRVKKRRQEEAAEVYLDASKAEAELGWKATRDLGRMCEDLWPMLVKGKCKASTSGRRGITEARRLEVSIAEEHTGQGIVSSPGS